MTSKRELAFEALFSLLQTIAAEQTPIVTVTRILQTLEKTNETDLPRWTLTVGPQSVEQRSGLPPKRTLDARLHIYVSNPQNATVPAGSQLNNLIETIESALEDPDYSRNTLSGAVYWSRVEGQIEIFEAPRGQRAAAIVPIRMLLP